MTHSPLLLQLAVILLTARLLGFLLRRLGQSAVIGEMAAGLVLGPIVFGALAPELHARVFPEGSLAALNGLSQLGLVLFMFIVGAELRLTTEARRQLVAASWIGVLAVLVPMALGLGVAKVIYPTLAPAGVGFWPFALFMACSLSVTAFPVMARILRDRRLTHSSFGRLSLTAAAVADVLAWVMLVLVVVLAHSVDQGSRDWPAFWRTIGGLIALAAIVFGVMKPIIARLVSRHAADGKPPATLLAALLVGIFVCGYATEILDVHAVFGAFLFGACLPRDDKLLAALVERIEYLAILALMPIFFALAGLNTTLDAFAGPALAALLLVLGAAVVGKLLGATLGARIGGQDWRTSLAVGSLMNARGMMELIMIKVGVDIGVIGPELCTMLMVMAIVTTLMAGPLLTLVVGRHPKDDSTTRDAVAPHDPSFPQS